MTSLTTKQVYLPVPTYNPPPAQSITFPKPLSYEFRVAETVDIDGKITRVALQVQVWEHDEYGAGTVKQTWTEVPRYKFDSSGSMLIP